jgi:quinoprotein glucose dehydrogenase
MTVRSAGPCVAALVLAASASASAQSPTWSTFNGDLAAQKYSPLTDITPQNVKNLRVAWKASTGDVSAGRPPSLIYRWLHRSASSAARDHVRPPTVWSATPLFVNDTLYVGTPFYRIFAYEPDSGRQKWVYDTKATLEAMTQPALKNRGVAYWQAAAPVAGQPCQKRVYIGTMQGTLHAVDADSGRRCGDFGKDGVVDINQWNRVPKWPLSILQPPTVIRDLLIVGWAGKDWEDTVAPPGNVFALDARTGERRWTFESLPPELAGKTGTANVWASMSYDAERDLLFMPVSSPSANFYGGNRTAEMPLVTSVTALRGASGAVVWSRQLVHHDLWDYDTNAAPTLVDLERGGRKIPALVQTSKQGFLYVLDRTTGEPLFPIEERAVPRSNVPGETAAPTQPWVAHPKPVIEDRWPGVYWLADVASFGWCSRTAKKLRDEGKFTPPSLEGSILYPGTIGGVEWGGGAVDPRSGVFVVNFSSVVMVYQLLARQRYDELMKKGGSETDGFAPQLGGPYGINLTTFLNPIGMPCWEPPYGSIAAYDLNSGEQLWKRPFGVVQQWGFYMPDSWGSVTIGGPAITASGLVFIGGSMDSRVRALDLKTGEVLWKHLVAAPAVSLPAIYKYKGKQYVTFAVGGNSILTPRVADEVVAFSLP